MKKYNNIKLILMVFFSFILFSCTNMQHINKMQNLQSNKYKTIEHINNWHLKAKISIKTINDSALGLLSWKQDNNKFNISISTPIGLGYVVQKKQNNIIETNFDKVKLSKSNNFIIFKYLHEYNYILYKYFYWWIRGLKIPNIQSKIILDENSRIKSLKQHGWHIIYNSYLKKQEYCVPQSMTIEGFGIKINIFIKEWQFL